MRLKVQFVSKKRLAITEIVLLAVYRANFYGKKSSDNYYVKDGSEIEWENDQLGTELSRVLRVLY